MRCIYVLHCPTARKTYYKIGKTTNLKQRLRGYNSYLIWGYKVVFRLELPDETVEESVRAIGDEIRRSTICNWSVGI